MEYPTTQPSLLDRLQRGDEISWSDFYHRYSPIISCAGRYYHFSDSECEDLVQQVMLKFFANSQRFVYRAGQVKFRSYFAKLIHSQVVDNIRRNAVQSRLQATAEDVLHGDFHEVFMTEWRKTALAEAKEELKRRVDEKTFQAFEMYGLQNRNAAQVAEILGMSVASLYTAKSRCMKMMQEIIARYNRTDGELNLEL